jgi:hypothetical protein
VTRLPHENRNVVDRPDLPEYELNKACPVTGEVTGLENHHIWRRQYAKSWWIELWDGTVIGNRVNLSSQAHYRITTNQARISYEADGLLYWVENGDKTELKWQPPRIAGRVPGDQILQAEAEADWFAKVDAYEETLAKTGGDHSRGSVEPGDECPSCKRRVPHPKKATSPKTRVYSTRVPIDDAETFKELVDAAAEHAGLKSKAHHEYNTLLTGLTLILQSPPEHLPGG